MSEEAIKVLVERKNEILQSREHQLNVNYLGWKGGNPYIQERLSRFASESDVDWNGGSRSDGSTVTGRKERAYVVPYLGRIVDKVNEFVFGVEPTRTNISTELEEDITSKGKSINELMIEVSSLLTVNGWCWIGIDAPAIPSDVQVSQEQKSQLKIRPYAQVYKADQVVDWYINASGEIQWLITESVEYIAINPYDKPYNQLVRRLWEKGKVTKIIVNDTGKDFVVEEIELSYKDAVPFVLVGVPSAEPHQFDSLESVNRSILDLCSANFQNYYQTVYPQLVLPASVLDMVMSTYSVTAETATTMVKGFSYPILLSETDQTPSYLMPDSSSIESMRNELTSLKKELFESAGMLIKSESSMAESAEAKAFDQLDLNMLIRARATKLEDAEKKLAIMVNGWDPSIPVYEVEYRKEMNSMDEAEEAKESIKEIIE
jgi:hypothetical protein